jgi:hypothetical protein
MVKQIIIGALIVVLVGAVGVGVYDAVQGDSSFEMPELDVAALVPGGSQGQGQGDGGGQGGGQGHQGQGNQGDGNPAEMSPDWVTLTGTVISADAQSMRVDTAELGEIAFQLGLAGFAEQQGVVFSEGDEVTVSGFEGEEGMFEAGQVNNDTTGEVLMLRDPNGRPLWAGQGQGGSGGQGGGDQGQGHQGQGNQGNQGQGKGGESGQPQAQAKEWTTITGVVSSVQSSRQLLIDTEELGQLIIQLGRPGFAEAQGVVFSEGDEVTVLGFSSEGEGFQAGQVNNDTTGEVLMLRDPNGRPLWAGQGQGQGGGGQNNQQAY